MPDRAAELIRTLSLEPHPEGGHYREVFRSLRRVVPDDGRDARSALTTIYFLLRRGECSRLHQVRSDEVWNFHEGAALELTWADVDFAKPVRIRLADVSADARPQAVVPADAWQGARTTGDYTFVSCVVGPGFDFADFRLLRQDPDALQAMRIHSPELEPLL